MTRQEIDAVFERVRAWPQARQEDAARTLMRMEEVEAGPFELTDEDIAALDAAEAEGDAGSEDVEAFFARYRR